MGRFSALPLRRQLFLAIFLLFIPLFAAVTWSGWLSFRERRNELGEQAEFVARTVGAVIGRTGGHGGGVHGLQDEITNYPVLLDTTTGKATPITADVFTEEKGRNRFIAFDMQ